MSITLTSVWEWLSNLAAVLRLGSATLSFGVAVHRAIRHMRRSRES